MTSGSAPERVGDAAEILDPLVMAATVGIHGTGPGNAFLGSGFFVAPNWVLTCAHVARAEGEATMPGAPRGPVCVGYRGRMLAGVVEWAADPGPDTSAAPATLRWASPDLALIRLLDRAADHPCVWLSERSAKGYNTHRVAYFGLLKAGDQLVPYSGQCAISGQLGTGTGGLLRLSNDDEMPQGLSGGPVVDLVRGEVIGVLRARRQDRDGGLAVSVQQLRGLPTSADPDRDLYHRVMTAHDLYHADRHRFVNDQEFYGWTEAHTDIGACAGRALTPGQRTELLGRLAQLPPPAGTRTLEEIVGQVRGGRPWGLPLAPRSWRDGLGLLYDLRRGSELEAVLRYVVLAATAERPVPAEESAEEALWEWAEDTAGAQGLARIFRSSLAAERAARLRARDTRDLVPDPALRARAEARLEIIPRGWEPGRYDWRVTVAPENGEVDCVQEDFRGTAVADLPARLAAPLAEAFRRCDEPDHIAALQLAVPGALVAFAADTWRLDPAGPALGAARPLVVRRTDPPPDEDEAVARERQDRWHTLHRRRPVTEVLDCDATARADVPEEAGLRARPRDLLPVLCRSGPAAPEALHRLVRCGYAVALWRRDQVADDRVCADFHRGARHTVRTAGTAGGLPAALAGLRAAVADGVPEAYWSTGLTLLYDDPTRPLPGADELLEAP